MRYESKRALALLRDGTNRCDTLFREGQEEAIRYIVEGRGRLLVVQKTGWARASSISSTVIA
jgi:ATP-dependent DNA helicase RecQ